MSPCGRRDILFVCSEKRQADPYGALALILLMPKGYRIAAGGNYK